MKLCWTFPLPQVQERDSENRGMFQISLDTVHDVRY